MKKILLFLSVACVGFSSCDKDDDNNTNAITTAFLTDGTWTEVTPHAGQRGLSFGTTTGTLSRQDGTLRRFTYTISGNKLLFTADGSTTPVEHPVKKINEDTMEVGNIAIGPPEELVDAQTVTFRKNSFTIDN
nr:hypothetical protein [uncultured Flavobacterium sp.]